MMGIQEWGKCEAALAGVLIGIFAAFYKKASEEIQGEYAPDIISDLLVAYAEFILDRAKKVEFVTVPVQGNNDGAGPN